MKKFFSLLMCAAALVCVSCTVEEEKGWEGTQLVVTNWPDNVSKVSLKPDNSKMTQVLYDVGTSMAVGYSSGNSVLTIEYERLGDSEYDEYFGYGIRSDSEKPFKVFINGEEAENENPAATKNLYDEERELNVSIDRFRTSFDLTGVKTVEVTFKNAPEKIKNRDLRLADENQWAYIDKDGLYESFKSVNIFRKNSNDNWVEVEKLGRNGLYVFDAYGQTFSVDYTVKDGYYSTVDDARFTVSGVENAELTVTDLQNLPGTLFNCEVYVGVRVADGTVISLTGGKVTAYDTTAFSGKSLTYEANISGTTEVTSASLSLQDDSVTGKTFDLSIDGNEWAGTWIGSAVHEDEDSRIVLYLAENRDQYISNGELLYYPDGLIGTTGPCWILRYKPSDSANYSFILTEKK